MGDDDRYLELISPDEIRVRGTRVGVEQILAMYRTGRLAEDIAVEFPIVTLEQVYGVLAWYLRNRAEAEAYLDRWESRARQSRSAQSQSGAPEVVQRLRRMTEKRVAG